MENEAPFIREKLEPRRTEDLPYKSVARAVGKNPQPCDNSCIQELIRISHKPQQSCWMVRNTNTICAKKRASTFSDDSGAPQNQSETPNIGMETSIQSVQRISQLHPLINLDPLGIKWRPLRLERIP